MVSAYQMKVIKLLALMCTVVGVVSCSKQSDKTLTAKRAPANVQRFVEEAAIKYAMRVVEEATTEDAMPGAKLLPVELKVKWSEKKDGYWLVTLFSVPEAPSGYFQFSVTEDGVVEPYEEWYLRRLVSQNKKPGRKVNRTEGSLKTVEPMNP